MSGHTEGPWVAIYPSERCFHNGTDITTYEVMTEKTRGELRDEGFKHYRSDPHRVDNISIVSFLYWKDMLDDEAKANANLIAAAPDNYECNVELAKIVRELCASYGHPLPQASLDRSDLAIAKATGETK